MQNETEDLNVIKDKLNVFMDQTALVMSLREKSEELIRRQREVALLKENLEDVNRKYNTIQEQLNSAIVKQQQEIERINSIEKQRTEERELIEKRRSEEEQYEREKYKNLKEHLNCLKEALTIEEDIIFIDILKVMKDSEQIINPEVSKVESDHNPTETRRDDEITELSNAKEKEPPKDYNAKLPEISDSKLLEGQIHLRRTPEGEEAIHSKAVKELYKEDLKMPVERVVSKIVRNEEFKKEQLLEKSLYLL
eukprot:TRINITY_DN5650_c0_g3_i1.p1 TRINITY_DN5650_c0_g3~~TRINITY_DN5650_c0_g3_i1.p1  ORF type:complete len:252 (-),score=85.51 TRINITY_DN5650_c0_g3_i1:270-1025(-)